MKKHTLNWLTGLTLALLMSGAALSGTLPPSGELGFAPARLTEDGGVPVQKGALKFQGQEHRLKFSGLGMGGSEGLTVNLHGEIYGLANLADLEGNFTTDLTGAPVGEASLGDLWLYNDRGVSIRLHTDNPEVTLAPGADAVTVKLDDAP
ncbi:MAG: hypothetical protein ACKN9W_01205 [Methylococcus sp.]